MHCNAFKASFNAPTSMTTKLEIAILSAPQNGIIFEFGNNEQKVTQKMRYFDCSFVSCFGNEEERLFVQSADESHHFHMLSIRNMQSNENYALYMAAMHILDRVFCNGFEAKDEKKVFVSPKQMEMINHLIRMLMDKDIASKHPDYIQCILSKWSKSVTNVTFDSHLCDKIVPDIDVFDEHNQCLLRFDKLNVMFSRLKSIYFDVAIGSSYQDWIRIADMLAMINAINDSKLEQIYIIHRNEDNVGDEMKLNWSKYQEIIQEQTWQIVDVDNKAFCLSRDLNEMSGK